MNKRIALSIGTGKVEIVGATPAERRRLRRQLAKEPPHRLVRVISPIDPDVFGYSFLTDDLDWNDRRTRAFLIKFARQGIDRKRREGRPG